MGTFVLSQDAIIVEPAFTPYLKQTKWKIQSWKQCFQDTKQQRRMTSKD